MKKMVALFMTLAIAFLCSCGEDNDVQTAESNDDSIIGVWCCDSSDAKQNESIEFLEIYEGGTAKGFGDIEEYEKNLNQESGRHYHQYEWEENDGVINITHVGNVVGDGLPLGGCGYKLEDGKLKRVDGGFEYVRLTEELLEEKKNVR